jgi:hypothetical protein
MLYLFYNKSNLINSIYISKEKFINIVIILYKFKILFFIFKYY